VTRLVVGSAFRDSGTTQIGRWAQEIGFLANRGKSLLNPMEVRAVAVWGDSSVEVQHNLRRAADYYNFDLDIIEHSHGGPRWVSVEDPARMAALSGVANAVLDAVQPDDDYLFYVESDLIWTPETVLALIERALRVEVSSTRSAILMSGALARDRRVRMSTTAAIAALDAEKKGGGE